MRNEIQKSSLCQEISSKNRQINCININEFHLLSRNFSVFFYFCFYTWEKSVFDSELTRLFCQKKIFFGKNKFNLAQIIFFQSNKFYLIRKKNLFLFNKQYLGKIKMSIPCKKNFRPINFIWFE